MSVGETHNSGVTFTHPTGFYLPSMQIEICQLSDILVHSCDADKMEIKTTLVSRTIWWTHKYYLPRVFFVAVNNSLKRIILWLNHNYSTRMTYYWLDNQLQPLHEANAREQIQESCDNQVYLGPGLGSNFVLTVEGPSYLLNLLWTMAWSVKRHFMLILLSTRRGMVWSK